MGLSSQRKLPADLVQARGRFQAWRQRRKASDRIPQALWTLAVRLGKLHGLSRTATVLGLDYTYSAKLLYAAWRVSHKLLSDTLVREESAWMLGP